MFPMASPSSEYPDGVELRGAAPRGAEEILSPEAVRFVADLARRFESTRQELLHRRRERQQGMVVGRTRSFLPEPPAIRERPWQVAPTPADLRDRRVEIT